MTDEDVSTLIVSRAARARRADALSAWLDKVIDLARGQQCFAGSLRLGEAKGLLHLILRFHGTESAATFQTSDAFRDLLDQGNEISVGRNVVRTGDHIVATLPNDTMADNRREFLMTWLAVYPPLLLVVYAIRAVLPSLSIAIQLAISSLILTGLLQFLILPWLKRTARSWLLRADDGGLKHDG